MRNEMLKFKDLAKTLIFRKSNHLQYFITKND